MATKIYGFRPQERLQLMDKNIEYYNKNAKSFFDSTVDADMSLWRDKFESYVVAGGRILDAGCGSGRDSKAFMKHGFSVLAFDASREMCQMASDLLKQRVRQMRFEEMEFDEEFHGVWACASLLHVSSSELPDVLRRINKALVSKGALYVSFKYGDGSMTRGERSFSNFNEITIVPLLETAGFSMHECGITSDVRPGRAEEKWINAIARKQYCY